MRKLQEWRRRESGYSHLLIPRNLLYFIDSVTGPKRDIAPWLVQNWYKNSVQKSEPKPAHWRNAGERIEASFVKPDWIRSGMDHYCALGGGVLLPFAISSPKYRRNSAVSSRTQVTPSVEPQKSVSFL